MTNIMITSIVFIIVYVLLRFRLPVVGRQKKKSNCLGCSFRGIVLNGISIFIISQSNVIKITNFLLTFGKYLNEKKRSVWFAFFLT
jgi:hypothetical protein